MVDKATRDEIHRFLVVQQANSALPTKYASLMLNFEALTPEQFESQVDEIVDEIEQEELRLKKQRAMFAVIEQDQAYYASLIEKTND